MTSLKSEIHETIIIGSGPAGYTAAIYASRASLNPVMITGHEPGGQLTTTTDVENFPGFPEGVTGPQLMEDMKKQAVRFGTTLMSTHVKNVNLKTSPFELELENGEKIKSKTIIISTGASAKYLGLANEKELIGKGVSACATCDGFFYRDKKVYVVGGGDTALEEAMFLTKFANYVGVIHRRDTLRASKAMQTKAIDNPKIEFIWNTEVRELLFDQTGLTGLKLFNNQKNEEFDVVTNGFFYGIGHTPNTSFLNNQLELKKTGYIQTIDGGPKTSIPGVFACGDVQDDYYRQAITAAGSGCQAAIACERYLEE